MHACCFQLFLPPVIAPDCCAVPDPRRLLPERRLSGNMYRLTDGHLRTAGSFGHVTALDLSQCAVADLAPLARLFRLRSLECNWCTRLEPASLHALSGLSQLTKLDLSGCARAATDEGLQILACVLPESLLHLPQQLGCTHSVLQVARGSATEDHRCWATACPAHSLGACRK